MERTTMYRAAAAAAALALITGGGVLAGCGSDIQWAHNSPMATTPQETLEKSLAAANSASSVTVEGSVMEDGHAVTLDLVLGTDAAEGTIKAQGLEVDVRVVGGKSYFKMSGEAIAKVLGQENSPEVVKAVGALIGGKWLVMPSDSGGDFEWLNQLAHKDTLFKRLLAPNGEMEVTGTGSTADGVPVVYVNRVDGGDRLLIQRVGEPYPVQIEGAGDGDSGTMSFTNWNAPVSVTAPTNVIDLAALTKPGDGNPG